MSHAAKWFRNTAFAKRRGLDDGDSQSRGNAAIDGDVSWLLDL
jgi:hypothetical protein